MSQNINIPKLGMSMREATLVEWRFKEGDKVNKGDVVLIIETEKTTWEVEAMASGFLHILVPAGPDSVEAVGNVVGVLVETIEELEALQKESGMGTGKVVPDVQESTHSKIADAPPEGKEKRRPVSPVARKMAEQHGIDLGVLTGTGPGGRITKKDVEAAIESKNAAPAEPTGETIEHAAEACDGKKVKTTISLKHGMRKFIARHMKESLTVSAQLTSLGEIDMTEVIRLRTELLKKEETMKTRITYTDIIILAVARALKDHSIINASIVGDDIKIWEDINIGVAVALPGEDNIGGGLLVPVIKHADKKSLIDISKELKVMINNAKQEKIFPDDLTGGTFTITNLGGVSSGYTFGTPIINQPESAILGTGTITDRPVVRNGEIVIRPIMTYSFTFDHRVIDGAPAAAFMTRVTELLELPALMMF